MRDYTLRIRLWWPEVERLQHPRLRDLSDADLADVLLDALQAARTLRIERPVHEAACVLRITAKVRPSYRRRPR